MPRQPGRQSALLRVPRPLRGLLLYLRKTLCHPDSQDIGKAQAAILHSRRNKAKASLSA